MGTTIGTPQPRSLLAEVLHLADAGPDVVVLHGLSRCPGHGLHVAAGHAAVGVQTLVDDDQVAAAS